MLNKELIKKIKKMVETICKTFTNYNDIILGLDNFLTRLTDESSPRAKEFSSKYNLMEIARSKNYSEYLQDLQDGSKLFVIYYDYKKAPNETAIAVNYLENFGTFFKRQGLELYIIEKEI